MRNDSLVKLKDTTKSIYVRKFHLVADNNVIEKHTIGISVQNKLFNYALKYLECTFGYKHLDRKFPNNIAGKRNLSRVIVSKFIREVYGLKGWKTKTIGLHSQAVESFLVSLLTNFGEYHKILVRDSRMSNVDKVTYKVNGHKNNPKHQSWYRKGSLNYLRNKQSTRTIDLPSNGIVEIVSDHHIKLQHFGIVQVRENLKNFKNDTIATTKIKLRNDGRFELQIIFKKDVKRVQPTNAVGCDWNMTNNEVFHTSDDNGIQLDDSIIAFADDLEKYMMRWLC